MGHLSAGKVLVLDNASYHEKGDNKYLPSWSQWKDMDSILSNWKPADFAIVLVLGSMRALCSARVRCWSLSPALTIAETIVFVALDSTRRIASLEPRFLLPKSLILYAKQLKSR